MIITVHNSEYNMFYSTICYQQVQQMCFQATTSAWDHIKIVKLIFHMFSFFKSNLESLLQYVAICCQHCSHRFSQKWQLRVCKWNFRVCKMPIFMKIPMKMKRNRIILGCAIGLIACAKHRCTGGWLKLWLQFKMLWCHCRTDPVIIFLVSISQTISSYSYIMR